MPNYLTPIVLSRNGAQHMGLSEDDKLSPASIPVKDTGKNLLQSDEKGLSVLGENLVDPTEDNELSVTIDGKLYVGPRKSIDPNKRRPIVSTEEGNYIRKGIDGGAFVDGNDILSNAGPNLLSISPVDGKVMLSQSAVSSGVSSDAGNLLRPGSDKNPYLSADDLVSSEVDNVLRVGSDAKLFVPQPVSSDAGNAIVKGSDTGAYFPYDFGTMSRY